MEAEKLGKMEDERPWERAEQLMTGKISQNEFDSIDGKSFDPNGDHGIGDIFLAARLGNVNRVRQLVEGRGENVNKTKWSGVTALHRAASEGQVDVVDYLIKKGKCDVNAKTTFGWHTPLHFACRSGHEDCAMTLIESGAVFTIFNKDRETPQHWARAGGFAAMGRKLEQLVNQTASKHRRAKVDEMEEQYAEKRRKAKEEALEEEEEEKMRLEEEENTKQLNYQKSIGRSIDAEGEEHQVDPRDIGAQLPVNLPKIEYIKRGRKQVYLYNKLINRSVILQPKRYGAESTAPSMYVTRNKVNMPGVTDTEIKAVGELSRHFRKTRATRHTGMTMGSSASIGSK
ncbi:hypothetical protein TL16_g07132 [Triparma laevis f. inornata]|uniref:Uncharacterized protein n=1 Tax=Triparma laevis f. inornata TaxID=1714386 RepID=A0A9W7ECT4_9STRA|nr:hypothetical protein TL16_g07132 [Triparma laevis f. inornata]